MNARTQPATRKSDSILRPNARVLLITNFLRRIFWILPCLRKFIKIFHSPNVLCYFILYNTLTLWRSQFNSGAKVVLDGRGGCGHVKIESPSTLLNPGRVIFSHAHLHFPDDARSNCGLLAGTGKDSDQVCHLEGSRCAVAIAYF